MFKQVRLNQLSIILTTLLTTLTIAITQAQEPVVISFAAPELISNTMSETLAQFEAENPDIRIHIVNTDEPFYSQDTEAYLGSMAEYASEADVLTLSDNSLSIEATRAGYLLDLAPLIRADATFNENDIYPAMWQSFQWDGGIWALPVAGDLVTLVYNPAAFDAAGLAYPDELWTFDDFENAVRALAERNPDGTVASSGFLNLLDGLPLLLMSNAGQGTYDPFMFGNAVQLNTPAYADLLTRWQQLQSEGFVGNTGNNSLFDVPLLIGPSLLAGSSLPGLQAEQRQLAVIPGGRTGLSISAIGISAGTQHPEAAYRLASYLTQSIDAANAFLNPLPARRSLAGIESQSEDDDNNIFLQFASIPPELIPLVQEGFDRAIPFSETLFSGYLNTAFNQMQEENINAATALQNAEVEALDALAYADAQRGQTIIAVAPPPTLAPLAPGQIEITFGIQSFINPLPNADDWQAVVDEFVANNPDIGRVTLDVVTPFGGGDLADIAEETDCFYQASNIVPQADLSLLLSIGPLLASDASIPPDDFAGNSLSLMERAGQLWGVPLHIQPQVMWYNEALFQQAGAFPPYAGWTAGDFESALRTLSFIMPPDEAPFESQEFSGSHLLPLIAAYGGLPIDYRTNPVSIDFTSTDSVEAIRQVLDLAREGLIDYTPLVTGGGGFTFTIGGNEEFSVPLYSQTLSILSFLTGGDNLNNGYTMTSFPTGSRYTPLAYSVGGAHISANTPHVEACYRFISRLTQAPELFNGMPARRSQLNNPALIASQGPTAADFYREYDNLMLAPNAVLFASFGSGGVGEQFLTQWLYRAFDRYVADENTDLLTELQDAEQFTRDYQACIADIPPFDPGAGNIFEYFQQFSDCVANVDPTMGN